MSLLKWAAVFAIIAVIAGVLGFTEIAGGIAAIARGLFFLFLVVVVILVVGGIVTWRKIT